MLIKTAKQIIIIFFVLLMGFVALAQESKIFKSCTKEQLDCPKFSLCSRIPLNETTTKNIKNSEDLKCLCLDSFNLNLHWPELENATVRNEQWYCLPVKNTTINAEGSSISSNSDENKLIVYIRSPARKDHLAFSILLVLLAATLATAALYALTVLRPLKRTKAVYKKLKYKRQNITPLQEMDELEMNRRYDTEIEMIKM